MQLQQGQEFQSTVLFCLWTCSSDSGKGHHLYVWIWQHQIITGNNFPQRKGQPWGFKTMYRAYLSTLDHCIHAVITHEEFCTTALYSFTDCYPWPGAGLLERFLQAPLTQRPQVGSISVQAGEFDGEDKPYIN